MQFRKLELSGAFVIEPEPSEDQRGSFFRTFCAKEFAAMKLPSSFVQCNVSRNHRRGTLRGMHFQREPHQEGKLVRCVRGRIFDVIIDLRSESPTFGRWSAVELDAASGLAVFAPAGFAHGFQALEDNSEVFYQMTACYAPIASGGIRWNDPNVAIRWPIGKPILSPRDAALPNLSR